MLDWHRQLIQLRRTEPILTDGVLENVVVRFDEAKQWLVVERGALTIACNLAAEARGLAVPPGSQRVLLASRDDVALADGKVALPPDSVVLLKRES